LDAVDAHLREQEARELLLLDGRVRDVGRLLAVAQRRVHDLDAGLVAGVRRHGRVSLANPFGLARRAASSTVRRVSDSDSEERAFVVAPADAGRRLDAWLAERLAIGRAGVRRLLESGRVAVDGRPFERRDKSTPLASGARVAVAAFAPPALRRAIA